MTFFGAGVWIYGRWNASPSPRSRNVARVLALLMVAFGTIIAWPYDSAENIQASGMEASSGDWKPWSKLAVERALNDGRPVFVDFTAAWCVTCQVNKQFVLRKDSVQRGFESANVELLEADWTNRNPEIGAQIDALGRNGIPVYVFYRVDGGEPMVLPELLTESIVLEAIADIKRSTRVATQD
ncbi:MAG: DUF255 domain-containing protein [Burkholderiales bacterium]|nr:DUF255 domain-containing protein [Burkholderiales bacterium]